MKTLNKNLLFTLLAGLLLTSCLAKQAGPIKSKVGISTSSVSVTKIEVIDNQLIITGTNLGSVKNIKLEGTSLNENFSIESITSSKIIANSVHAFNSGVSGVFNLILSDASAAATFAVSFTPADSSVTASKLAPMGATSGQVLKFNGTAWEPSAATASQAYLGTYNMVTNVPNLNLTNPITGDYYIVSAAPATPVLGITWAIGDWIIYNGANWEKVSATAATIASFKGRIGTVVPAQDDYSMSLLSDINFTTAPVANDILTFVGGKWTARAPAATTVALSGEVGGTTSATLIGNNVITNTHIADGALSQDKISGLTIALSTATTNIATKENAIAAGAVTTYFRGDKSFQTLNTAAVPELTNLYYTDARVLLAPLGAIVPALAAITTGDSIQTAFNKTQGQINSLGTNVGTNFLIKTLAAPETLASNVTVTGTISATNASSITVANAPIGMTEVTNKSYVDNSWISSGTTKTYNSTAIAVGIGTSNPTSKLHVNGGIQVGPDLATCDSTKAGTMRFTAPNVEYCNGSIWKPFGVAGAGIQNLTAGTGLTGGVISTDGTIAVDVGTTANKILQLDAAAKIPAVDGSQITNVNPSNFSVVVPVTKGGTGLAIGTSGGLPYYNATTTMASSGLLTLKGVILGGGAGGAPTSTAAGIADQVLRIPASGGAPVFGAIDLTKSAAVTGALTVANGGTGTTSGTSGGIPYFSSTSTIASSSALTQHGLMVGGGVGVAPSTIGVGTAGNYLKSMGAADPAWSSIILSDLKSSVAGNLFPAAGCSPEQHLIYSVITDSFTCSTGYWAAATGGINYAGGNVGIGTTNPGGVLDVQGTNLRLLANSNGNLYLGTGAATVNADRIIKVDNADAGNTASATFWASANGASMTMQSLGTAHTSTLAGRGLINSTSTNGLVIYDGSTNSKIDFLTNASLTPKVRIDSSGNVGIGMPTPTHKLEVQSSAGVGAAWFGGGSGADNGVQILAGSGSGQYALDVKNYAGTGSLLYVRGDGNVGIGTTTPQATLDVGGTGAFKMPVGTTAQRPATGATGMMRFNTDTLSVEYFNGSIWSSLLHTTGTIASGGTETTIIDGGDTYRIHTFTTSGTFTVTATGHVEVLVVAGGGSGGNHNTTNGNGGGGGGGVIYKKAFAVTPQAYTVTVGNGGAAIGNSTSSCGNNGGDSVFSTLTALGGGGGGSYYCNGKNGGSGGGGAVYDAAGGVGIQQGGYGNEGGRSYVGWTGGGGGGAGSVGNSVTIATNSSPDGNGGRGLGVSITGSLVFYAGGGGGGGNSSQRAGDGFDGGGRGYGTTSYNSYCSYPSGINSQTRGSNNLHAIANTGGGGGAGSYWSTNCGWSSGTSGAGGSGIVIVRYIKSN